MMTLPYKSSYGNSDYDQREGQLNISCLHVGGLVESICRWLMCSMISEV